MTETEMEMYETEMYRCVREICTGVLHGRRTGVLDRLTAPGDGCRITNQSVPASERERARRRRNTQTRLAERDHVSRAQCWLHCRSCLCAIFSRLLR